MRLEITVENNSIIVEEIKGKDKEKIETMVKALEKELQTKVKALKFVWRK